MHPRLERESSFLVSPSTPFSGTASLFLAIVWPLSLGLQIVVGILDNHQLPGLLADLTTTLLLLAPPLGIILGHIGIYRAGKIASLRHLRWRAIIGTIFSYLWLISIFLISDLGAALVYWLRHL